MIGTHEPTMGRSFGAIVLPPASVSDTTCQAFCPYLSTTAVTSTLTYPTHVAERVLDTTNRDVRRFLQSVSGDTAFDLLRAEWPVLIAQPSTSNT